MIEKKLHYHKYLRICFNCLIAIKNFLNRFAYESNNKHETVATCIDNECQTTAGKQDTYIKINELKTCVGTVILQLLNIS